MSGALRGVLLGVALLAGAAVGVVVVRTLVKKHDAPAPSGGTIVLAVGSGSGAVGSGSATPAGSGSATPAGFSVDCTALAKVAKAADEDVHIVGVRGRELSRAPKGGDESMGLVDKYVEITYEATVQAVPGTPAVIKDASSPDVETVYRVDLHREPARQGSDGAYEDKASPAETELSRQLAELVRACMPTWTIDSMDKVENQTTFRAPDDLAYIVAGYAWGDDEGTTTTVSLQVIAESAKGRADLAALGKVIGEPPAGSGSGSAPPGGGAY